MSLDNIKSQVTNGNVTLLCEIPVNDKEYQNLLEYTKRTLRHLNSSGDITFDIPLSVTLVQIAIREYKDGNYWDCFLDIFPEVSSAKKNLIGSIFYNTIKIYKLFMLESENSSRMQYVENIKAHAFVPNNYLEEYIEFLFSFYNRNLLRNIPEELSEDIEELQDYLSGTLNSANDSFKLDTDCGKSAKSYKLLKSTRLTLSKLDVDFLTNFIKPHLIYIDEYYFDNKLPHQIDRFQIAIHKWSELLYGQFIDRKKRKRKSEKGHINRSPYYCLTENSFEVIVPEQKFRDEEYIGYANLNINEIKTKELELYRAIGKIFISEETRFRIDDIFNGLKISIESKIKKEYTLPQKKYRIFDEDKEQISKFKLGYCYLAVQIDSNVRFNGCDSEYINTISNSAKIYYINIKEKSIVYIDEIPLSLSGEFSLQTQFNHVSNEYQIYDLNGNNIKTAYKHPVISFTLDKKSLDTTILWCNEEKFDVNIPYTTNIFEMSHDTSKFGISIDLNNILIEDDRYYKIVIDEPGKNRKIIEEYLLIPNIRCSTDKRRYSFCNEAKITISGEYEIEALNTTVNEDGSYVLNLDQIVSSADFNIFIDHTTYKLCVPIKVIQFGFNGELSCKRNDYIWYNQISNRLSLILPGATQSWIYLNKNEYQTIEGEINKNAFNFDISEFVEEIRLSEKPWNYLNIKYIDNKERKLTLFRVLKDLWFNEFYLTKDDVGIYIFADFQGDIECFVKIIDFNTKEVVVERETLITGEKVYFPRLEAMKLYTVERYSSESDAFGFSEDIKSLKHIYKIGVINHCDISNCKVEITTLFSNNTSLELDFIYTVRDLVKLNYNSYIGNITCKPKNKLVRTREYTVFQKIKMEVVEFDNDNIHFVIYIKEDQDWVEPLYDKNNKIIINSEESNLTYSMRSSRYILLFEEETEFVGVIRRDK